MMLRRPAPWAVFLAFAVLAARPVLADEGRLSPYERPEAVSLERSLHVTLSLAWVHNVYRRQPSPKLHPKGFGLSLQVSLFLSGELSVFAEGRTARAEEEQQGVELEMDTVTVIGGFSHFLPGTRAEVEEGGGGATALVFFHAVELGAGSQSFEGDREDAVGSTSAEVDESATVGFVRYRAGTRIGPSAYFEITVGAEAVRRRRFDPPVSTGRESWDVDTILQAGLSLDL